MHIILGEESAIAMREKYVVLELDKIQLAEDGDVVPTYCVIGQEDIPLIEIAELERIKNLHRKLLENFYKKDWNFCEQALEHLQGRWKGTLNSFYDSISNRVAKYKDNDPGPNWNGIYKKFNNNN